MRRTWLVVVGVLLIGGLGSTFLFGYLSTHRHSPRAPEPPRVVLDLSPETVEFVAQDGLHTFGWLYEQPGPAPCAVVLVHGNGSSRTGLAHLTREVLEAGCHALPITVRAHGDAEGERNDFGYSARLDVEAAVERAAERFPKARLGVLGVSLGAAAALFAAEGLGAKVQGYLLESPYASLEIAIENRVHMLAPDALAPLVYFGITMWSGALLPVPMAEIAPMAAARHVPASATVRVLSGDADRHATPAEAHLIIEALPEGARLVEFEGAAHNQLYDADPGRYRRVLRQTFTATPSASPRSGSAP